VGAEDDEGRRGGARDAHDEGGLVEGGVGELRDGDGGVGGGERLGCGEEPGGSFGADGGLVVAGVEAGESVVHSMRKGGEETYSVMVLARACWLADESWAIRGSASARWDMVVGYVIALAFKVDLFPSSGVE